MKIICSKNDLMKGVFTVSKAVPAKTNISILECILIDATGDDIRLIANDTQLGIETVISGVVEESGVVALDARIFSDIVKKLPENEVTITTDASFKTVIICEKSTFNLVGKSGEDFSYLPYIEKKEPVMISQLSLKDVIRQTIFSTTETDANKVLSGELISIKDDNMSIQSLDGLRVSVRNIKLQNSYTEQKAIVPAKTLNELSKIMTGGADDIIQIYITDNHITFMFDDTTVVSRLIDGEFMSLDRMTSSDYKTKVTINKRELLECIDRATLLVKEGDKKPIIFDIHDELMQVMINSFIGSMDAEIDINKSGEDIKIGFNPKFLIDVLRVIDDEEITIYLVHRRSPIIIKDDDESYIYIVLPVNFTGE